jgi:hypothetical protein
VSFPWQRGRFSASVPRHGSMVIPVAFVVAVTMLLAAPRPAAACLAYDAPKAWTYDEPPRLVMTAVITEAKHGQFAARPEMLFNGSMNSPFEIGDSDGCHLPEMRVGQRIALVSGLTAEENASTISPGSRTRFSDFSGPIWLLDEAGDVLPMGTYPRNDAPYFGPPINGVVPHSLAEILQLAGMPDAAMAPPSINAATPLGIVLISLAGLLLVRRRVERDMK